jgi:hypothetical protein
MVKRKFIIRKKRLRLVKGGFRSPFCYAFMVIVVVVPEPLIAAFTPIGIVVIG